MVRTLLERELVHGNFLKTSSWKLLKNNLKSLRNGVFLLEMKKKNGFFFLKLRFYKDMNYAALDFLNKTLQKH